MNAFGVCGEIINFLIDLTISLFINFTLLLLS